MAVIRVGVVSELAVSAREFALAEASTCQPGVRFEVVRFVARSRDRVLAFLLADAPDLDAVTAALRADATAAGVERLATLDAGALYRMELVSDADVVGYVLLDVGGAVLDAVGDADRWTLRVLFPGRNAVSAAFDYCENRGLDVSVRRIADLHGSLGRTRYGLTERQHEALAVALDGDYFAVPRGTTVSKLSDDLGISHQALSERLRRGQQTVLENVIDTGDGNPS